MAQSFTHAFPLESLGSDIAKNNYNYEAIFNALMEWNSSKNDTVTVRLTKNTYPYFHDYTFPTKSAGISTLGKDSVSAVASGAFAFDAAFPIVASADADSEVSDKLTLRVNVSNNGHCGWTVYANAYVHPANVASTSYIAGSIVRTEEDGIYIVNKQDATPKTLEELIESGYAVPLVRDFEATLEVYNNNFIVYNDKLYVCTSDNKVTLTNAPPAEYNGAFKEIGYLWNASAYYNKGDFVAMKSDGTSYNLFVNLMDDGINSSNPANYVGHWVTYGDNNKSYVENNDNDKKWQEVVFLPMNIPTITSSGVFRFAVPTDIKSIVLRNSGSDYADADTNISIVGNVHYKKPESIYDRKVNILSTSNYAMYPFNKSGIWKSTSNLKVNESVPLSKRQSYSASMIFDHGQSDIATINYINYDGPDVDQGLCIYLPVESTVDDGIATPEDGYTFEFFFRIWPNPSYNGAVTNDNIINKSQIYVYSVRNTDAARNDNCSNPIAKFSMARLTNFYVYDENIAIANRPVMYRATFVYSATEEQWKIFDYYQLPDHVFIGPVGFVDPTNAGELQLNNELGNEFNGLETAGFPMFADPFSDKSLK